MEKLKQNRALSFVIVGLVYLAATVLGIAIYKSLSFDWWLNLLISDVAATVFTFIFSLIFKNASVYDPYWSVQPIVVLAVYSVGREVNLFGLLLIATVVFWGIRLTVNWAYTFKNLCHQDWRYTMLKEKTGKLYFFVNLTGIHLVPTLIVWGCVLPAVYALVNGIELRAVSLPFIALSFFAALLQLVSDIQMHKYRRDRKTPFICYGLWKYSRHPNYLGEILMWWGIGLAVVSAAPEAYILLSGAIANTILFLFVSIPMADGRQSSKEGFAEYKKATRMLLPIKK